MTLNYLSTTSIVRKLVFIGGTNLRLVKGIDRFSEDLDFDCKNLSAEEFMTMTDGIICFLNNSGFNAQPKDKENEQLKAFRRSIYFPELLFEMGLSAHREERFMMKIESQDQQIGYTPTVAHIQGCGYFFPVPVPPDGVLCSMKLSALLTRAKGRDFYDAMFLLMQSKPDYDFLKAHCGVADLKELKARIAALLQTVDLRNKQRDFEHLLFEKSNSAKILQFGDFMREMK
jgi:predicted nucleotidyltransferase component of viral defense system